MEIKIRVWKVLVFAQILLFTPEKLFTEEPFRPVNENINDTSVVLPRFVNRVGVEFRPEYVMPTNPTLKGDGYDIPAIKNVISTHFKYSSQFHPESETAKTYGDVYQGIGVSYYAFDDDGRMGNPLAFYLFQGARIAQATPWLSFNYEWNFGVSYGWNPYDYYNNYYNQTIGSEVNAYINANFYLNWTLPGPFDLTSGITFTHFSNGNTQIPNAGLNTIGLKLGFVYNFNRARPAGPAKLYRPVVVPAFKRHISYDVVLFGSWRRKGVDFVQDYQIASPESYPVAGFTFAPMYNFSYKFRAGVGLDGVYDKSANIYMGNEGHSSYREFIKPPASYQMALGLSGRAEFVMPYFTVGIGLGGNVIHRGGDLKAFYQILALKVEMTRNSFLHIGYSIHNFHDPNFLMIGIGYRFNNKNPLFYR